MAAALGERPASVPEMLGIAHKFYCAVPQFPTLGCMADTTGPMPLIRWRGEGKRRLRLGFTSRDTWGMP